MDSTRLDSLLEQASKMADRVFDSGDLNVEIPPLCFESVEVFF